MQLRATLLSPLYLAALPCLVSAGPLAPKDNDEQSWNNRLMKKLFGRQDTCTGTLCGYYNQLCCVDGEQCYTDLQTMAHCSTQVPLETLGANLISPGGGQSWSYSTYTTTNAVTVTTSYYVGAAPITSLTASTQICANGGGCGAICCDMTASTCGPTPGQCIAITATQTTGPFSAPLRVTTATTGSPTMVAATTTGTFAPAIGTSGSTFVPIASTKSKGLSPGAIAGIVIGVIAGIIFLLLICFCCILKAGFDGLLALFGLRNNRKTERTEVIEERYSRHGGSASRRDTHSGWFGGGGGSRTRVTEKKKSGLAGETGIFVGIAAALAGLWAILGLRKKKKSGRSNASDVSYETYTDSYSGTSASSASSDRRTRESRRASRPPRSAR